MSNLKELNTGKHRKVKKISSAYKLEDISNKDLRNLIASIKSECDDYLKHIHGHNKEELIDKKDRKHIIHVALNYAHEVIKVTREGLLHAKDYYTMLRLSIQARNELKYIMRIAFENTKQLGKYSLANLLPVVIDKINHSILYLQHVSSLVQKAAVSVPKRVKKSGYVINNNEQIEKELYREAMAMRRVYKVHNGIIYPA